MKVLQKKWWWQSSFILLLLTQGFVKAQSFQNLVPNGSFETYTQCPNNSSQVYFATPWTGPSTSSSDYFNACSSVKNVPNYCGTGNIYPCYLSAISGDAYAGIYVYSSGNYREYLQVKLTDSLKNGDCYYVEFYVANIQWVPFAVNNIAANLSSTNYPTTLTPQNSLLNVPSHITNFGNTIITDTIKWHKVSGIYEAQGNECYITIGNFNTDSNTDTMRLYPIGTGPVLAANMAYIFVDSVSVYRISPHGAVPWSYQDTTINEGDSVFIGNNMGGMNFQPQWFTSNGNYIETNAGILVKPTVTSNYIVQYTLCGVVRSDTVKVTVIPALHVGLNKLTRMKNELKIYPVPAQDYFELSIQDEEAFKVFNKLKVYNQLGQLVRKENLNFKNNSFSFNLSSFSNGVYSLELLGSGQESIRKRFVVAR